MLTKKPAQLKFLANMVKELQRTYFVLIVPAIVLSTIFFILQYLNLWEGSSELPSRSFMVVLFVLAISTGVAIPIFLRALFFGKAKEKGYTRVSEFVKHQKIILYVISLTPYFALLAAYMGFDAFYFGGISIAAIYAIYYHFPSEKKIKFDSKVFMVKNGSD
jgi:hypothetical protein